ncbi:glycoside hydrolase [Chloropicon primus]|uniref:Glycoside hydrolase n=2 Tax=Chloropicon primus TaxID=1764295 RepID=A0A5B8MIT7_9CHLO|nr:glycoside hydrolase [Chloropicon primus]UPQ99750.1 glycoside hydrolase [Chloropicon primus]|eukprot:QDZ20538.1 glycoside hydrolase [Chloropicon primus]
MREAARETRRRTARWTATSYVVVTTVVVVAIATAGATAARTSPRTTHHEHHHHHHHVLKNGVGPELYPYDPVANASSVVKSGDGKARFTILTDRLIRMEYSDEGTFEDRASLAFVNRNTAAPVFSVYQNASLTQIKTEFVDIEYTEGQGSGAGFGPHNLAVNGLGSKKFSWKPGQVNEGRLPGAIKSLDTLGVQTLNCTTIERNHQTVHNEKLHCNWALFSRSGWTVFDDATTPMINPEDVDGWWEVEKKNKNKQDLYFFGHGLDFLAALRDYRTVGGVIPMLPKAVMGVWWTRWFNYNTDGIKDVVNNFRMYSLPMDVLVYDMNWHIKDGSPDGWTGYSWDERVLPNHSTLNRWLKKQNLMLSANLHDDEGVGPNEARYPEACSAAGIDPATKKTIPFSVANKTLMLAVEDQVLAPLKANGSAIDFFWVDWQQGGKEGGALGGRSNPTIWLNKVRCTDALRHGRDERNMVLGRWGGLGNHRYQLGFSADIADQHVWADWSLLAYQPYFSASGSNVGYGFWSHDILTAGNNPELSLRWVQWGANSAVMRFHDRGLSSGLCNDPFQHPGQSGSCDIDLIWKHPAHYFQAMRAALQRRAQLLPYLYNAVREAFDTGVSLIRPLYYYHSDLDMSYTNDMEGTNTAYYFGPSMIVAPVVSPVDKEKNLASTEIWLPPGAWIEVATGSEIASGSSGSYIKHAWDITEVPTYVKAGAIIPISLDGEAGKTIGQAGNPYLTLGFEIYPAATPSSQVFVYEDDGKSLGYLKNEYALTEVNVQRGANGATTIQLKGPDVDKFPWWPVLARSLRFSLVNSPPAASVKLRAPLGPNGPNTWQDLKYDDMKDAVRTAEEPGFYYDGSTGTLVVSAGVVRVERTITIEIEFVQTSTSLSSLKGVLSRANLAKEALDAVQGTPGFFNAKQGSLERLSSMAARVEADLAAGNTASAMDELNSFTTQHAAALKEVQDTKENDKHRKDYALELLSTAAVIPVPSP